MSLVDFLVPIVPKERLFDKDLITDIVFLILPNACELSAILVISLIFS